LATIRPLPPTLPRRCALTPALADKRPRQIGLSPSANDRLRLKADIASASQRNGSKTLGGTTAPKGPVPIFLPS
jgi:hypothetical protein